MPRKISTQGPKSTKEDKKKEAYQLYNLLCDLHDTNFKQNEIETSHPSQSDLYINDKHVISSKISLSNRLGP